MKKLNLDEIKQYQLSIMIEVDSFCRNNNIPYSLCYGTLLGAVRHKGYIPWDDDIDIMMLRKDYDRFIREFSSKHYRVYIYDNCNDYNYPFAKVSDERTIFNEYSNLKSCLGVNIDIFPIDNLPNDSKQNSSIFRVVSFYKNLRILKVIKINKSRSVIKNFILLVGQIVLAIIPQKLIVKTIDKKSQKWNNETTNYVGCIVEGYGVKERCRNVGYNEFVDVEFEGYNFKAIKSYDTYLTNVFGDYMTLPPEDKRVTHHTFEAFEK